MMDYDAEERAFDALVAEQRARHAMMRRMRCTRMVRYVVEPDLPVAGLAPDHLSLRTFELRCERPAGHPGNCGMVASDAPADPPMGSLAPHPSR